MKAAIVVGNPKPQSRTLGVATDVVARSPQLLKASTVAPEQR
jgi:hypothetical protein